MSFARVALAYQPGGPVLWSPRNSLAVSRVSEKRLSELVPRIRSEVSRAIAAGPSAGFDGS